MLRAPAGRTERTGIGVHMVSECAIWRMPRPASRLPGNRTRLTLSSSRGSQEKLDQRNDNREMCSQCAHHPFQEAGFNLGEIDLGGQVSFEQVYLFVRQGLGLRLGEAAGREVLHEPVGVKCDHCGHVG